MKKHDALALGMMRTAAIRTGDPEIADRYLEADAERKGNGAIIDGQYRYVLWRRLAPLPNETLAGTALWIMLNPSVATAWVDDPTIRKVCGFSRRWGFAQARVVNLYALRSTNPKALWKHEDPIGPENDEHIMYEVRHADALVLAWGNNAREERARQVRSITKTLTVISGAPRFHLGLTQSEQPKHPLMLGYDTERVTL